MDSALFIITPNSSDEMVSSKILPQSAYGHSLEEGRIGRAGSKLKVLHKREEKMQEKLKMT